MNVSPIDKIKGAVFGNYPIIYLLSWEEDRVERMLFNICKSLPENRKYFNWTFTQGFRSVEGFIQNTQEPMKALEFVLRSPSPGFYVLKDFHRHLADNLLLIRRLRDCYYMLKGQNKTIFLLGPVLNIPIELKKEIYLIEIGLPGEDEIRPILEDTSRKFFKTTIQDRALLNSIVNGLKGFTYNEIQHVLNKVFYGNSQFTLGMLDQILLQKEQITHRESPLEFIYPRYSIDDIGGYDNLKQWLKMRANLFTPEARDSGVPIPKGLLMMGISGCGKSLAVKVISTLWNLPLFRLDMGAVFSGQYGSPEMAFSQALRDVESIAPVILWIDEIEAGMTGVKDSGSSPASRILAAFLTWMQEKESMVFVAATANRIDLLPAEFIRKGRFDQVFFFGLPNERERVQIFKVHLQKRNITADFDFDVLAKATEGWNGAEIESCVASAIIEAHHEKQPLSQAHLLKVISHTIPLSQTMTEQIKQIKSWAHSRALSASPGATGMTGMLPKAPIP
ncbi:MAG: AAA family ATPase [Acidobacteriota bacterium]|nr:AAA family ATPase [Acidobacteriota bacterium]